MVSEVMQPDVNQEATGRLHTDVAVGGERGIVGFESNGPAASGHSISLSDLSAIDRLEPSELVELTRRWGHASA